MMKLKMKYVELKNEKIKLIDNTWNMKQINIYTYDFQQYDTITSFGDSIYTGKISIDEVEMN